MDAGNTIAELYKGFKPICLEIIKEKRKERSSEQGEITKWKVDNFCDEVSQISPSISPDSAKRYLHIGTNGDSKQLKEVSFEFIEAGRKVLGLSEFDMWDLVRTKVGRDVTDLIFDDVDNSDYFEKQFYDYFFEMPLVDCYFMCDCYELYSLISFEAENFIQKYLTLDTEQQKNICFKIGEKKVTGDEIMENIENVVNMINIRSLLELRERVDELSSNMKEQVMTKEENNAIREELFKKLKIKCNYFPYLLSVVETYPKITNYDLFTWITFLLLTKKQQVKINKLMADY